MRNSREKLKIKTRKSRKKLKTQGRNSKLKEKLKTQEKKLNFSAYSYVGQEEKVAKL